MGQGPSKMTPPDEVPGGDERPKSSREDMESNIVEVSVQQEGPPVPTLGPDDVVIVVMGLTGVGKSTFIKHFCDKAIVGKTLKSCTSTISVYPACIDDKTIYLVDTPGFDDENRTDMDILRDTASWLLEAYDAKVQLAGVVYLHRIQDNRVSGTIAENIDLFRELCGQNGLASVVLATTMWDTSPDRAISEAREKELVTEDAFWGQLVRHGCTVMRQDDGHESASKILRHILATAVAAPQPTTLLLQDEIVAGAELHETGAGTVLKTRLEKANQMYAEVIEEQKKQLGELLDKIQRMEASQKASEEERERERQEAQAERDRVRERMEEEKTKREEERRQQEKERDQERQEAQKEKEQAKEERHKEQQENRTYKEVLLNEMNNLKDQIELLREKLEATTRKQERAAEDYKKFTTRGWFQRLRLYFFSRS